MTKPWFRSAMASLVLSSSVLWGFAAAQAQSLPPLPKAVKDAGTLRIGVRCDAPPFGQSATDGKPAGIEIDIAKQLGVYAFGSADKAELSCVTTDRKSVV